MDNIVISIAIISVLFVIIFVSGYRLNKTAKPYNTITFNIHKLIGLAVIAVIIVNIYSINQISDLGFTEWISCIIGGLLFLSAVVSGGMLSIDKQMLKTISMIHKIISYLIILTIAIIYYQLT